MKRMNSVIGLLAVFLLLACLADAGAAGEKALTVMVYMCGSNLETLYGCASADLQEMLATDFDSAAINLVVMAGGSEHWKTGYQPDEQTILQVEGGRSRILRRDASRSMGDPETLRDFLRFSMENYPAEDYALILWDHGGGPLEGLCRDERYGADHLSLRELAQALDGAVPDGRKLSWIGFDACLMGSLEVAEQMRPYARCMIASQAEEPVDGWNYAFLSALSAQPDAMSAGRLIVDAYFDGDDAGTAEKTLCCIDLDLIGGITAEADRFFRGAAARLTPDTFSDISRLRMRATGFGRAEAAVTGGYDLVDLVDLCDALSDGEESAGVRAAVGRAVYSRTSTGRGTGLSVYHPFRNRDGFLHGWYDDYLALDFCGGYTNYIRVYGEIMTGRRLVAWDGLSRIETDGGGLVRLTLTPEQANAVASARLVIYARNIYDYVDQAYYRVFSTADVAWDGTTLRAAYDGTTLRAYDDAGHASLTQALSYRVAEDGRYLVEFYPVTEDYARTEHPIIGEYTLADGILVLQAYAVYDEMTGMYSHRAAVDLSGYMGLTFRRAYRVPQRNDGGELPGFDEWLEDQHADAQWKTRQDVDTGSVILAMAPGSLDAYDLYAAFEITDTQGATFSSDLLSVGGGAEYYRADFSLGSGAPEVTGVSIAEDRNRRTLTLTVDVRNASAEERTYMLNDVLLNGVRVKKGVRGILAAGDGKRQALGYPTLLPGSRGQVLLTLDAAALAACGVDDVLSSVVGRLYSVPADDSGDTYILGFSAEPNCSVAAVFQPEDEAKRETAVFEVPFVYPAIGDRPLQFSCVAAVEPHEEAVNARLLVNTGLYNDTGTDIIYLLTDIAINGRCLDKTAASQQGEGAETAGGRRGVATENTAIANLDFRYGDIRQLLPDPALRTVSGSLLLYVLSGGEYRPAYAVPVIVTLDVPVTAFCENAALLPSWELMASARAEKLLSDDRTAVLFSGLDCAVRLQGYFIVDCQPVMLLRCENRSDRNVKIWLGGARMDGQPAGMGVTGDVYAIIRNCQLRLFDPAQTPWPEETGVQISLSAGETRYEYVSVAPAADGPAGSSSVRFNAFMYPVDNPLENVYIEDIVINCDAGAEPGKEYIAVPDDDGPGHEGGRRDALRPQRAVAESVSLPSGAPELIPIAFNAPEGGRLKGAYCVLMRRVRNEKELAQMNLLNHPSASASDGALHVSFRDGGEWMIYEQLLDMMVAEDGLSAHADWPAQRLSLETAYGTLPVSVAFISRADDGFTYTQTGNKLVFGSAEFPNAVLGYRIGAINVTFRPDRMRAWVSGFRELYEDVSGFAGIASQKAFLLRRDTAPEALAAFLNNSEIIERNALEQVLLLDPGDLRLTFEPADEADYLCVFFYQTEEGAVKCTSPRALRENGSDE